MSKVMELHKLIGRSLDEEGADHLSGKGDCQELFKIQAVAFMDGVQTK